MTRFQMSAVKAWHYVEDIDHKICSDLNIIPYHRIMYFLYSCLPKPKSPSTLQHIVVDVLMLKCEIRAGLGEAG